MDLQEFVSKFADQFENTEANELTGETKFHELLEWDSMLALSIIAMIDDEYGVVGRVPTIQSCPKKG